MTEHTNASSAETPSSADIPNQTRQPEAVGHDHGHDHHDHTHHDHAHDHSAHDHSHHDHAHDHAHEHHDHPNTYAAVATADPVANGDEGASDVDMEALLETVEYIRPALQADGGDLVLLGVDGGTVNLQLVGACGGCPMSTMTLKAGIERIMFDRVPGVEAVNAI